MPYFHRQRLYVFKPRFREASSACGQIVTQDALLSNAQRPTTGSPRYARGFANVLQLRLGRAGSVYPTRRSTADAHLVQTIRVTPLRAKRTTVRQALSIPRYRAQIAARVPVWPGARYSPVRLDRWHTHAINLPFRLGAGITPAPAFSPAPCPAKPLLRSQRARSPPPPLQQPTNYLPRPGFSPPAHRMPAGAPDLAKLDAQSHAQLPGE